MLKITNVPQKAIPAVFVTYENGANATFVLDDRTPMTEEECQIYSGAFQGKVSVSFGFRKVEPNELGGKDTIDHILHGQKPLDKRSRKKVKVKSRKGAKKRR